MLKPPSPPPPPIDCAITPAACKPAVVICPRFSTSTVDALPAVPPAPPTPICPLSAVLPPPEISIAPLPPPPPIDCANTPVEKLPLVAISEPLLTLTAPPLPPVPPSPPIAKVNAGAFETTPLAAKPPLPPPPPIDCAMMPSERMPVVLMIVFEAVMPLVTVTAKPAPPPPPVPPIASPIDAAPVKPPLTLKPPLPPPPPIDCATIPFELMPVVTIVFSLSTPTVFASEPLPPPTPKLIVTELP